VSTLYNNDQVHAVEIAPIAVVRVVVACAWVSVVDFSNELIHAPRAALPAVEVSLASLALSLAM